jgi:hypothetical protein
MPLEGKWANMAARSEETLTALSGEESGGNETAPHCEKVRKELGFKSTSRYHLMDAELLRECVKRLWKEAAAGIDELTKGFVSRICG